MLIFFRKFFIVSITWFCVVTILSVMPGNYFPKVNVINFDKVVHFILYFTCVTALLWSMYFHNITNAYLKAMAFSIIYSILIEIIHGNWCINRSFDLFDILANSIGAIAASLLIEFKFKNTRLFAINKT
jgi:hypothetical protein